MNKSELVAAIAKDTGVTKKNVDLVIKSLTANITAEVKKGGKVQIPDLGSFRPVKRAARKVRNPRTGEPMTAPACTVAKFTVAKALKEAIR